MSSQILEILVRGRNDTGAALADAARGLAGLKQTQEQLNNVVDIGKRVDDAYQQAVKGVTDEVQRAAIAQRVFAEETQRVADGLGRSSQGASQWTDAQQRAAMAMSASHDQALKMNAAFDESKRSVTELQQAFASGLGIAGFLTAASLLEKALSTGKDLLVDSIKGTAEYAHNLEILSTKTAMSTTGLQELGLAAKLVGKTTDDLARAVTLMEANVARGAPQAAEALAKLHLSPEIFQDSETALRTISARLQEIGDVGERANIARALLGRGGLDQLPVLMSNLDAITARAHELGVVISEEDVQAAAALAERSEYLAAAWEGLLHQFGLTVVRSDEVSGAIKKLTDDLADLSKSAAKGGGTSSVADSLGQSASAMLQFVEDVKGSKGPVGDFVADLMKLNPVLLMVKESTYALSLVQRGLHFVVGAFGPEGAPPPPRKPAGFSDPPPARGWLGLPSDAELQKMLADTGKGLAKTRKDLAKDQLVQAKEDQADLNDVFEEALRQRADAARDEIAAEKEKNDDLKAVFEEALRQREDFNRAQVAEEKETARDLKDVEDEARKQRHEALQKDVDEMRGVGDVFGGLASLLGAIGGDMSVVHVFEGISGAMSGLAQHEAQAADNLEKYNSRAMTTAQRIMAIAAALQAASSIASSNKYNRSGEDAALSGAASGAAAGAAFGPEGIVIGALAGAVIGFFSGAGFRDAAHIAGTVLGHEVSDNLAKAIYDTMQTRGVSAVTATLLNLGQAMQEGMGKGLSAASFGGDVLGVFAGILGRTIPVKEGIQEIGTAFQLMAQEAQDSGGIASDAMLAIIAAGQATGLHVKEITEYVKTQAQSAAAGIGTAFTYLAGTGELTAQRFKALGASMMFFIDQLRAQGVSFTEIFDLLGDQLDKAQAAAEKAGISFTAVLGPILHFRQLVSDNKDLVDFAESIDAIIRGLANLPGGLDNIPGAIDLVKQAMEDMLARGFSLDEALAIMAGSLRDLDRLAREGKITLDDQTKAWIEAARAKGLLDATPQEQMQHVLDLQLLVLVEIAKMFHATLPQAVQDYIDKLNQIPTPDGVPGGTQTGSKDDTSNPRGTAPPHQGKGHINTPPPPPPTETGYATGFFSPALPADHSFTAHRGERVEITPASDTPARNAQDRAASQQGGGTFVFKINLDGAELRSWIVRQNRAGNLPIQ